MAITPDKKVTEAEVRSAVRLRLTQYFDDKKMSDDHELSVVDFAVHLLFMKGFEDGRAFEHQRLS